MGIYKENIPKADMLMGSMRSMGYSFESAIADVITNKQTDILKMKIKSK